MKKSELQILNILRESKKPLCAVQIMEKLPGMKEITIRKALQILLQEDWISVSGMVQNGKNYARTFTVNEEEERKYFDELARPAGKNAFGFACELLERNVLSDEEVEEIKKLIDKRMEEV